VKRIQVLWFLLSFSRSFCGFESGGPLGKFSVGLQCGRVEQRADGWRNCCFDILYFILPTLSFFCVCRSLVESGSAQGKWIPLLLFSFFFYRSTLFGYFMLFWFPCNSGEPHPISLRLTGGLSFYRNKTRIWEFLIRVKKKLSSSVLSSSKWKQGFSICEQERWRMEKKGKISHVWLHPTRLAGSHSSSQEGT